MLDVRRLLTLREIAARGSFSAAAESLHVSQSAVSQQIAVLEREAGTPLLVRGRGGVHLTEAGEALVRHARVILARLADAKAEVDAIADGRSRRLSVASFPTAAASLLPQAMSRFRDLYPDVDVILTPAEPCEGEAKLHSGEVDIALLIQTGWHDSANDGLDCIGLVVDPMYVCLPTRHPKAGKARLRLDDLRDDAWLVGSTSSCPDHAIILTACTAAGFQPRISFQSSDYSSLQGFVAAGMGIALLPDLALVTVRDDVVIREIWPGPPVRHIVAATLSGGDRSPAAAAMLDMLATVGRELETHRRPLALVS